MRVLVTGAAGMLGHDLCNELERQSHEVIRTDIRTKESKIRKLDVTDKNGVFAAVEQIKPDLVAHLAAETDVDKCEVEQDHAYLTNTIGTLYATLAAQKFNTLMVYISTAGVFDGKSLKPYTEFDTPNPINVYGKSKYEGEKIVQNLLNRSFIIRPGWMVGGGKERDKKFVYKLLKQLEDGKKDFNIVTDKIGSLTYTADFAKNFMPLIETHNYGLYHMTNKGYGSRYDLAKKIFEVLKIEDINLNAVTSELYPKENYGVFSSTPTPAPRPDSEAMRNYKLELLGLNNMNHWEEAVEDYVKTQFLGKIQFRSHENSMPKV